MKIPPVDEGKFVNRLNDKGRPTRPRRPRPRPTRRRPMPRKPPTRSPTRPRRSRRRTSRRRPTHRRAIPPGADAPKDETRSEAAKADAPKETAPAEAPKDPRRLRRSGPSPKPSRRCWARPRKPRRPRHPPRKRRPRPLPRHLHRQHRPPRRRHLLRRKAMPPPDSRCSSPRSPTTRAPTRWRTSSRRPGIPAYTEPLDDQQGHAVARARRSVPFARGRRGRPRDKLKGEGYSGIVAAAK